MPPSPIGFSRLWFGPATKPSSEMEIWQLTELMPLRRRPPTRIIDHPNHLSYTAMLRCPGAPDTSTPCHQLLVTGRPRLDRQDVGHSQRPDILWWLESGPRL